MTTNSIENQKISALNDMLRQTHMTGEVKLSKGVKALPAETQKQILEGVKNYDAFEQYGIKTDEKDMGVFSVDEHSIFWRIQCYTEDGVWTCLESDDPEKINRVLSIKLMDEPYF